MLTVIDYKEIEVLFADYKDCNDTRDNITLIRETADYVRMVQEPNSVFLLIDASRSQGSQEFMAEAKKLKKEVFDKKIKVQAVIGINSKIKKVLLMVYNAVSKQKLFPFDTKEEALEYLYTARR